MITDAAYESYDEGTVKIIKAALSTLYATGIIQAQQQLDREALIAGSDSEDPPKLAARIIAYRLRDHLLTELHGVGEEANRELKR